MIFHRRICVEVSETGTAVYCIGESAGMRTELIFLNSLDTAVAIKVRQVAKYRFYNI